MFNILLDEYPEDYEGLPINTDFRVGILMDIASNDATMDKQEKYWLNARLLFGDDLPDNQTIAQGISWFLNGWNHDNNSGSGSNVAVMDFDIDQGRIYSAFLHQYHIDLNTANMHWWKFMYLLTNLEECSFTRVIDIRAKKIDSKMSKEERKAYTNAKKIYAIKHEDIKDLERKAEEAEVTQEFLKMIGKA